MASLPRPEAGAQADWALNSRRIAFLAWLLCCALMIGRYAWPFTYINFFDPDDALRLEQVRAWLAGQSWFDVTQYRVSPPDGAPMHWSRIVDLPIGALTLLARPSIGSTGAEILAVITVPLLLLGALTAATHVGLRRIMGGRYAPLIGTFMLLTAPSILLQFAPFRIDHHGWQIMLGAIATCGLFDPKPTRGGLVLGSALATWLAISSEGLPYAALYLGAAGILHLLSPRDTGRLVSAAFAIGMCGLILSVATRGLIPLHAVQCDALTVPYLYPVLAMAIATPIAGTYIGNGDFRRRLMVGIAGAGAAIITLALVGGPCLSGNPFQTLGPIAYRVWYMTIMEGRPVWEQDIARVGAILIPSLGGLAATLAAAYASRDDRDQLQRWLILALLLCGATLIAIMVMRALSMAHWLAIPGATWLVLTLLAKIQRSSSVILRVLGSASLIVLTPFGLCTLWVGAVIPFESAETLAEQKETQCNPNMAMAALNALPPSVLFAPLDIGPSILVRTNQRIIATGHHRNAAGITTVIRGFTERPDIARSIITNVNGGKGADYLVTCSDLKEYRSYAKMAPQGLAAQLAKGQVPGWLTPLPSSGPLRLYRIRPE